MFADTKQTYSFNNFNLETYTFAVNTLLLQTTRYERDFHHLFEPCVDVHCELMYTTLHIT